MKVWILFLCAWCTLAAAMADAAETGDGAVFRIGISSRTFEKINRNDAIAALKSWAAAVVKEIDLPEQPEVTWFDSVEELYAAFRQDRLDAVSITVEDAMLLGVEPEAVFLPALEQGFHVRYAVVVHRDGGIAEADGLAARKVAIAHGQRMILGCPWLETLLGGRRCQHQAPVENPSKAILQAYFRQCDAALVTLDAFEVACELNPHLREALRVLATSPPFITSFLMFRPTYQGRPRQRLEAAIMDLHTTVGGRQVLTVFQSSRMEKHPPSILAATQQFLAEYHRLTQTSSAGGARP